MSKLKYLGIGLAISLLLAGCSADKADTEGEDKVENNENAPTEEKGEATKENEEKNKEEADKENAPESSTTELTVDQETADLIEKDEGIEKAIIQLETVGDKKFVNGHIKLNTMMKGEETAEKYANMLKEKYPDRTADMIITMDDKILYQGTF